MSTWFPVLNAGEHDEKAEFMRLKQCMSSEAIRPLHNVWYTVIHCSFGDTMTSIEPRRYKMRRDSEPFGKRFLFLDSSDWMATNDVDPTNKLKPFA